MAHYYPPVAFCFEVRIAGDRGAHDSSFAEVSGLMAETDVFELREGGENRFVHRLPGRRTYRNLVLKRGLVLKSSPLFDWCKATLESDLTHRVETKALRVSLLDAKAHPTMTWSVAGAYPVRWEVATLAAQENAVAMETLEMAFQRIERKLGSAA